MNVPSKVSRRAGGIGSIWAQTDAPNSALVAKVSAHPGSTTLARRPISDSAAQKERDGIYKYLPVAFDAIAEHGKAICRSKSEQIKSKGKKKLKKIAACRWIVTRNVHTLASRNQQVQFFPLEIGELDMTNWARVSDARQWHVHTNKDIGAVRHGDGWRAARASWLNTWLEKSLQGQELEDLGVVKERNSSWASGLASLVWRSNSARKDGQEQKKS